MNVLWIASLEPEQIALTSSMVRALSEFKNVTVSFGLFKVNLEITVNNELPAGTIGLSENMSQVYTIPKDIPYEVLIKNGEIHIGPLIAFVDQGRFSNIKDQIYFNILPKFMDYHSIRGLVYICTHDSIDLKAGLVEGYYFDPNEPDPNSVWKPGTFPLPGAVFNRSYMTQEKIAVIRKKAGDILFNSYWLNLNKWILWLRLSKDETLKEHLPYTEKYQGVTQLKSLVNKYGSVYLKPYKKSRGRGIMLVTREANGVLLVDNTMQQWYFGKYLSLAKFLKKRIKIPYLVQQAVPFKINNQQLDFRLIIQKDGSRQWTSCGLMARIAPVGGIITNMRGTPVTMLGSEAMSKLCKLDRKTIAKIEYEMTDLAIRAAQKYEEQGMHLGDLAADLVVDSNLHVWLLELQLNHAIYGNTNILPAEFFKPILTNPFKYAKALAGFNR